jgi:hypothetical protein
MQAMPRDFLAREDLRHHSNEILSLLTPFFMLINDRKDDRSNTDNPGNSSAERLCEKSLTKV